MDYRERILRAEKMDELYDIAEDLYMIASSQLYFIDEFVTHSRLDSARNRYGDGTDAYKEFISSFMEFLVQSYGFDYDNFPNQYDNNFYRKSILVVQASLCKLGVIDNPGRIIDPQQWEEEQAKKEKPAPIMTNPFEKLEQSMEAMAEAMQILAVQNGMLLSKKIK